MRPINVLLPGGGAAGNAALVAAAQAVTANTPMTLVGVAGGVADPFVLDVNRQVLLTFAGNETGNNFTVHGAGPKGNEFYETVPGDVIGAYETEYVWSEIYSITPQLGGAGNVSVGTVTNIRTNWIPVDYIIADFKLGVGLHYQPTATGTVTVQNTHARLHRQPKKGSFYGLFAPDYGGEDVSNAALVGATGDDNGILEQPATAVRLVASTAITAGGIEMEIVQGHRAV